VIDQIKPIGAYIGLLDYG